MDMEELWSKTREVLRAEVNAVVYNSLLGSNNLVPALLDGDTLVLRVVMDNLKLLITNQWYSTIVRALSQVAGHQMDVEILTQEEIEARPQLKQKAVEEQETVLESSVALNPKYTFETFVVGSGLSRSCGISRKCLQSAVYLRRCRPWQNTPHARRRQLHPRA